ncbi:hypothetical protein [Bacillus benzoevorans]|uniref:Uncharacterized protein n=1 Tax=Bacillus benzoevorans TaxID=1456 RepID=A0A7X0HRB2_9BACI|nr:hypothetical protein [Bacillus benzoevorans]MBB6445493.1 hypothetical protein [Bacillus benzoevorans]
MTKVQVTRGQTISFRIPSDTPEHLVKRLQRLKETERRNFSSKIAEFVLEGVSQTIAQEREMIRIPLPHKLTKAQRDWLKFEHSEALIGSILYHLISDPVRAASFLTSLNSPSLNLDEALYQGEPSSFGNGAVEAAVYHEEVEVSDEPLVYDLSDMDDIDDDLNALSLENTKIEASMAKDEDDIAGEIDPDDILGDFLAAMNKNY